MQPPPIGYRDPHCPPELYLFNCLSRQAKVENSKKKEVVKRQQRSSKMKRMHVDS
jgi:hypothetical protein